MNATTTAEERHIFIFFGKMRVIYEVAVIYGRELGPDRVFNQKAIFFCLDHCRLRQPGWSVYLKRIRVLSRLQVLALRELDNCLLDHKNILRLPVIVLERLSTFSCYVTSLNTFELDNEIGCRENSANFNVNCSRYLASRCVAEHVIVQVDIDCALRVRLQRLIPEHSRVSWCFLSRTPIQGALILPEFHRLLRLNHR